MGEGTEERGTKNHTPLLSSTFLQTSFFPVEFPQWGKSARKEARPGLIFPGFPSRGDPTTPSVNHL